MSTHRDTKELSELVIFLVTATGATQKSLADGKMTPLDVLKFWPAAKIAPEAFKFIEQVPGELADLDPVEAEALVQLVESHFGEMALGRRTADIVDAALGCIPSLANLWMTLVSPPPIAQPA